MAARGRQPPGGILGRDGYQQGVQPWLMHVPTVARMQMGFIKRMQMGARGLQYELEPGENPLEMVTRYDLKYNGRPFDLSASGYEHLRDLYEDTHPQIAVMAGAQTGKSAWELARTLWSVLRAPGRNAGVYYPTQDLAFDVSTNRFHPMVTGSAELMKCLGRITRSPHDTARDNVQTRRVGHNLVRFLWFGRTSTESYTIEILVVDEVRRLSNAQLQLIEERQSAVEDYERIWVSTAGAPGENIDKKYQSSDQRRFHSTCRCASGCLLSDTYPNCIEDLRNASPERVRQVQAAYARAGRPYLDLRGDKIQEYAKFHACFSCPKCGTVIVNPRNGWWEAHNPDAYIHGYQLPQMLSPSYSPPRVLEKMENGQDVGELYRSMLGRPYTDASEIPVSEEDLDACTDWSLPWPATGSREGLPSPAWLKSRNRAEGERVVVCGIDVQRGYFVGVIKSLKRGGQNQLLLTEHVFVYSPEHPHAMRVMGLGAELVTALADYLHEWQVQCLVIDVAPEWQTVRKLQDLGLQTGMRVYLCQEGGALNARGGERGVRWSNSGANEGEGARGMPGDDRLMVSVHQVLTMRWSAERWTNRLNVVPSPDKLFQVLPGDKDLRVKFTANLREGTRGPIALARTYLYHQRCVSFPRFYRNEQAKKAGVLSTTMEHINGVDPHWAHAEMFANLAATRFDSKLMPRDHDDSDALPVRGGLGDEGDGDFNERWGELTLDEMEGEET